MPLTSVASAAKEKACPQTLQPLTFRHAQLLPIVNGMINYYRKGIGQK